MDQAGSSQKMVNIMIEPALQCVLYDLLMDVISERSDSNGNCEIDVMIVDKPKESVIQT